mmetsp:Transcript_106395/g.297921  ORF Transcript_106395/g.297921 Transcript_106395/m.297921 type:complete len:309 (-) Transcript_106395:693-1619(-)
MPAASSQRVHPVKPRGRPRDAAHVPQPKFQGGFPPEGREYMRRKLLIALPTLPPSSRKMRSATSRGTTAPSHLHRLNKRSMRISSLIETTADIESVAMAEESMGRCWLPSLPRSRANPLNGARGSLSTEARGPLSTEAPASPSGTGDVLAGRCSASGCLPSSPPSSSHSPGASASTAPQPAACARSLSTPLGSGSAVRAAGVAAGVSAPSLAVEPSSSSVEPEKYLISAPAQVTLFLGSRPRAWQQAVQAQARSSGAASQGFDANAKVSSSPTSRARRVRTMRVFRALSKAQAAECAPALQQFTKEPR